MTTTQRVYISLAGLERYNDQRFKDEELNKWIEENVDVQYRNYSRHGVINVRKPYLVGISLTSEQATMFKLKFGV